MHLIIIVWHRANGVLIVVGDVSRSVCYSVTSGGYCEMILMITDIIGSFAHWWCTAIRVGKEKAIGHRFN